MGLLTRSSSKPAPARKPTAKKPATKKPTPGVPAQGTPRRRSFWFRLFRALMILCGLAVLGVFSYWAYLFTLRPVSDPNGWAVGNTEPGHTLKFYLDRPSVKEAAIAIGGNLALLAPLGVLLPVIFKSLRGVIRLTLLVALISLGIEIVQGSLVPGRTFDVDDIILNTIGVTLTYLLVGRWGGRLVHGAKRPRSSRH